MKKDLICVIVILIIAGLTGCGHSENAKSETQDSESANQTTTQTESMSDYISLTSQITELESGLSAVKFDGDYALDLFLEQGGRGIGSGRVSVYQPISSQRKYGSSNAGRRIRVQYDFHSKY